MDSRECRAASSPESAMQQVTISECNDCIPLECNLTDSRAPGRTSGQTDESPLLYCIEDVPPWYLCLLLAVQHIFTAESSFLAIPILLSKYLCISGDTVGLSELIATVFFVSGIITLLQTTFGCRLPIIQGGSAAYLAPTIVILSQPHWVCEYTTAIETHGATVNYTALGLPEIGSEGHREMWMTRIREIQGAIMVAGSLEFVIGCSGLLGFLLKYIGPLSITPTISLIGLSLFKTSAVFASEQWGIAILTVCVIMLFSQILMDVKIPCPSVNQGRCSFTRLPLFKLFPVLLGISISWGICAVLTAADVLPNDVNTYGYGARTDVNSDVINKAKWFRFPYPAQWGRPTFSTASALGMVAAVIATMIESVGDYYACARLSGAPSIPTHAVNRGLVIEGIGCVLAGLWGTGNGTTSFSQNVGAIGITKVGSRRVVQVAGIILLVFGCTGKLAAVLSVIPKPVIGGLFIATFGMVTAAGLSNLQHVNLNSQRNMFVIGVSMFSGLCIPTWMASEGGKQAIQTGNGSLDQILTVLLSTHMLVGGSMGFIMDNIIPGTTEERGLLAWRGKDFISKQSSKSNARTYDVPGIQNVLNRVFLFRYIPCCPSFLGRDK